MLSDPEVLFTEFQKNVYKLEVSSIRTTIAIEIKTDMKIKTFNKIAASSYYFDT